MASVKAGKAYVEVGEKGTRETARKISLFSDSVKRSFKSIGTATKAVGLMGLAAVAAGVAAATHEMVGMAKAAMEAEERTAKFNAVFGAHAEEMMAWANGFADAVGRSQGSIQGFLSEAGDLFGPMGFDPAQARVLSKVVTQLAVDLGSFNNRSAEDVFNDLTSAMTGSSEVMKKYGVIVNETAVKQRLLKESIKTPNELQKAWARLAITLDATKAARDDALDTRGSATNSILALQAAWTNVREEIGKNLLPYIRVIAQGLEAWVRDIGPKLPQMFADALPQVEAVANFVFDIAAGLLEISKALLVIGNAAVGSGLTTAWNQKEFEKQSRKADDYLGMAFHHQRRGEMKEMEYYRELAEKARKAAAYYAGQLDEARSDDINQQIQNIESLQQSLEGARSSIGDIASGNFQAPQTSGGYQSAYNFALPDPQQLMGGIEKAVEAGTRAANTKQTETSIWTEWAKEQAEANRILKMSNGYLEVIAIKTQPVQVMGG